MNERSIRVLEFDKVKNTLIDFAQSEIGKEKCQSIKPINDIDEISFLQEQTSEANRLISKRGNPPLFGLYDVIDAIIFAEKGGALSPLNLLRIADGLRVVRELKKYISSEEVQEDSVHISGLIQNLYSFREIEEEIDRAIISDTEISDNASRELRSIRMQLRKKNDDIKAKLNSIVNSKNTSAALQDAIVTIREGRYVVPIRSEYKNRFPGVVHDQSSSGATVFIEPLAVVNFNNEIKMLELKETEEINRILKRISGMVGQNRAEIASNQNILAELDFIFARGRLSVHMNAVKPELNLEGIIDLKNAKHPLLNVKNIVPISIRLGDGFTTLVITGPNTGGKTVTLKTVGLLTLMAQSGLHIPAQEGSVIAVFDDVFSDIGDEQSIEQSLSTFSSHMTNIVKILKQYSSNSLILLDELGAGTDPTEGAALAMSILDILLKNNIRTIATTHYSQLKIYALSTEGVMNASVEFNVDTLSPTYRLLIGIPGKSNAFEISKRLGLDESLIDYAKDLISSDNKEFEDVLSGIEKDRKLIEQKREEIETHKDEIEKLKIKLNKEIENNVSRRERIIEEAKKEAYEILNGAKEEASEILREMNTLRTSVDKSKISKAHKLTDDLRKSMEDYDTTDYDFLNITSEEEVGELKLGDEVEIITLGQSGHVVELPDSKGNLTVEIGILKVNSNIDQIKRVKSVEKSESKTGIKNIIKQKSGQNIDSEIDIRGRNIEEAILELDKYIDNAYIVGLKEIRIIHGKGTGVLREGIKKYLRKHKNISKQRLGEFSEGGDGVTVATLK